MQEKETKQEIVDRELLNELIERGFPYMGEIPVKEVVERPTGPHYTDNWHIG